MSDDCKRTGITLQSKVVGVSKCFHVFHERCHVPTMHLARFWLRFVKETFFRNIPLYLINIIISISLDQIHSFPCISAVASIFQEENCDSIRSTSPAFWDLGRCSKVQVWGPSGNRIKVSAGRKFCQFASKPKPQISHQKFQQISVARVVGWCTD